MNIIFDKNLFSDTFLDKNDTPNQITLMHILDKDIKTKNMEQLEKENFYAKLINLKKEHENHMKQMENIYQSGKYKNLSPNRNSNKNQVTQTFENKVNYI